MQYLQHSYVRFGLLLTGLTAACLVFTHLAGDYSKLQNPSIEGIILTFLLPIMTYFLGIKSWKKQLGNKLKFKQGLDEGFRISLVTGITSPFVFLIFYLYFNPSLIDYARQAYGMNGLSNQIVVVVDMLAQLIGSVVFGTLLGAVISFFLKTK